MSAKTAVIAGALLVAGICAVSPDPGVSMQAMGVVLGLLASLAVAAICVMAWQLTRDARMDPERMAALDGGAADPHAAYKKGLRDGIAIGRRTTQLWPAGDVCGTAE